MLNNITIGQYYPIKSIIHKIDPRIKLVGIIIFIAMLLVVDNFYGYIFASFFILTIIKLSRVPIIMLFRGLKSIFYILIFTFVLNVFFTKGDVLLFSFYFMEIYLEGIFFAFRMSYRLMLIVFASSILTLTTPPISLTDGIEKLLSPLKAIKIPAHEIAMIMTIALRFIPILMEELDKIMKAQMARGANFDDGNLIKKIKSLIPVLVPLFISAFRRADDLAMAMEARCYRGDINRTRMKELKFKKLDFYAILTYLIMICGFVFIGVNF